MCSNLLSMPSISDQEEAGQNYRSEIISVQSASPTLEQQEMHTNFMKVAECHILQQTNAHPTKFHTHIICTLKFYSDFM